MLGPLTHCTEDELLGYLRDILARGTVVTPFDETEITQINDEFIRRDRVKVMFQCLFGYLDVLALVAPQVETEQEQERRLR